MELTCVRVEFNFGRGLGDNRIGDVMKDENYSRLKYWWDQIENDWRMGESDKLKRRLYILDAEIRNTLDAKKPASLRNSLLYALVVAFLLFVGSVLTVTALNLGKPNSIQTEDPEGSVFLSESSVPHPYLGTESESGLPEEAIRETSPITTESVKPTLPVTTRARRKSAKGMGKGGRSSIVPSQELVSSKSEPSPSYLPEPSSVVPSSSTQVDEPLRVEKVEASGQRLNPIELLIAFEAEFTER